MSTTSKDESLRVGLESYRISSVTTSLGQSASSGHVLEAPRGLDRLASRLEGIARAPLHDERPEVVLARRLGVPGDWPDVSKWFGVRCKRGRVVGLRLFDNGLSGGLPRSVGRLSNLRNCSYNTTH